ncbi:hypothetical protein PAXINDRAFT_48621, partial [Paxillus involutus ATCC 200175]
QIQEWLKPHDSSINHKSARDACVKGTGAWFANDGRFLQWLKGPGKTLWISGAREYSPACAVRTVLSSTSVEVVHGHETAPGCCAHFYFDARESSGASRMFETLLRSILNQLCCRQADIPDAIKHLAMECKHSIECEAHVDFKLVPRFRLVAFWIDELKHCRSLKDVTKKLQHLPTSLNAMYTSMIAKITADDLEYAQAIMPWLLFSVERLKLEEIAAAACFTLSDGRPAFDKDRRFGNPKAMLDVFGGLVVMSEGTDFCNDTRHFLIHATDGVTLAHLTVKEFLLEQESPLHVNEADAHSFIAQWGFRNLTARLLLLGVPAMTRSSSGDTALRLALDVNAQDKHSGTPLCSACSGGYMDIVKLLLDKGADINPRGKRSDTPLRSACSRGHMDIVKLLLAKGADVNPQGEDSGTPLCSACDGGHMDIVKLLLEKEADVNAQGEYSDTPLRSACSGGDMDIVKLLLEKGADVNPQGEDSDTPLRSACSGGHMDIVKLLLEKGADLNAQGKYSGTPLRSACSGGHMDIVKLLLEKGADVDAQGLYSDTPLRSACSGGHMDIVKLLLEKGADVNAHGSYSGTPLCSACYGGHWHMDIIKLLLEKGADVNVQGEESDIPLHTACSRGHMDIVKLLLEKGADVNVGNYNSDTPLHIASKWGHLEVVQLLLEKGADPNIQNEDSQTPLDIARRRGHDIIVAAL